MNQVEFAFLLIIIAGFLQGTFGIFIKKIAPLQWENFWVIFSCFAYLFGPLAFAYYQLPNFFPMLFSLSLNDIVLPLIIGAVWGIGSVLFGLSIGKIGVSLTYSIVLGLVTIIGSVLPIFINHISFTPHALILLILGLCIITTGVFASGWAGVIKEKIQNPKQKIPLVGIVIAVISGVFSSLLNIGFVLGSGISRHAMTFDVSSIQASSLVWVIVIFGGFLTNAGYALFLLLKNRTFVVYKKLTVKLFFPILISAACWYITFALFGIGSTQLGSLGPSVGWAMLISLSIVISNIWGIRFGEWNGVKKALSMQFYALGLIIAGVVCITLSAL